MKQENSDLDIKNYSSYLDCLKLDSNEIRYKRMTDTRLCKELSKIWEKQKELKEKEDLIQRIRSMRYSNNNWFLEEMNSTELSF